MRPGDIVAERFEILDEAGSGGMATVYRARDKTDGSVVALKLLTGKDPSQVRRFAREARVLAQLRHPGIVRHVGHGGTGRGNMFLAMEWLEGEDLGQRLRGGRLAVDEAVTLARGVASALAAAHQAGVVHRDIKPANLFLPAGRIDRVIVVDFGVARFATGAREITATGVPIGTPGFMAPEQVRGQRDVDPRADVFALGCVLYRCLTGKAPFEGDDVFGTLLRVVLDDPPRVAELCPEVAPDLDDLIARMLSKARSARPRDGEALTVELARLGERPPPVTEKTPTADRPHLGTAERRTVLLFVARPENAADPDATTLVTEDVETLRSALRRICEDHGGRFDLLPEGAVLATFAGEDDPTEQAARAARCALSMRELVPDHALALAAWRGVWSGRLPMGVVIDRAVRLLAEGPGSVRLDDTTAGLLDTRFDVRGDGRGLFLAGKRDGLEAVRTLLGKPTGCVGRDREIALLEGLFAECESERVARAVLVTGAAGIGKSRLRWELLERLARRPRGPEVWVARGDPLTRGSAFALLAQALRRTAGVLDGESARSSQRKLSARVARHLEGDAARRVAAFVGELANVPFPDDAHEQLAPARQDAAVLRDQMRQAWEDLVRAEADAGPLVLVLEDLHWGDLPTVRFVDRALRALCDRPFLVLALARPEIDAAFPDLWADRPITRLSLGALTRKAAARLVRDALGDGLDDAQVATLVDRGGGNAFYLEELVRAAADGRLHETPETVVAMVEARLSALSPEARRVLRAASIFGQSFWRPGLLPLLGEDAGPTLEATLADLTRRELVERRLHGKFPPSSRSPVAGDSASDEYAFRHAIVREAAYAMLTDADRILGHELAGEWLETSGERDPLVLAEHFERGDVPTRAVAWYVRAAEQALEGDDLAAALVRAERGLACRAGVRRARPADEPPPSLRGEATLGKGPRSRRESEAVGDELAGRLHYVLAEAHQWRGENAAAEDCGLLALRELPRGTRRWYAASGEVAAASARRGNHDALATVGRELASFWPPAETQSAHVMATSRVAVHLLHSGMHELALQLLATQDERVGDLLGVDRAARAWALRSRASRALFAGDPAGYRSLVAEAVHWFREAGDRRSACVQEVNLGFACLELGAYAEAARVLEAALAQTIALGLQSTASVARHNLGIALAHLGQLDRALVEEREATRAFAAQGDLRMEGGSRIYLATIHWLRGSLDEAEREAREAVRILAASPVGEAHGLAELARVLAAKGEAQQALAAAQRAMALLEQLGGIEEGEALVRLVWAEALFSVGEQGRAKAALFLARDRLLARAARFTDPAARETFLAAVQENRRTLELAEAWAR